MDNATWALARMNMFLHGHPTAELWRGNTLAAPYFKNPDGSLRTFDFAVANPPFSAKAWSNGLDPAHDEFSRFEYGIPPARNGDYAFLLNRVASLRSRGKGAIILPHGVLFRGNREADIRRNLVRRGLIRGIIGLPPNLFYGTGIPACILVIDKENAGAHAGIFMIDASRGFEKDGNKNRLRAQDIHRIVDVFNRRSEVPRYSRLVPEAEIASPANDYNLNLPRYVDSSEPEDLHDLEAHLKGGIPDRDIDALDPYWVGSDRSALSPFGRWVSPARPPNRTCDSHRIRLSMCSCHRNDDRNRRPLVQLRLHDEYPRLGLNRTGPRSAGVHQRPPRLASMLRAHWTPSPCTRLSRARTTTGPPPHFAGIDRRQVFPPRWQGPTKWFPRSLSNPSTGSAPSYAPATSPRLRRSLSPWPPGRRP